MEQAELLFEMRYLIRGAVCGRLLVTLECTYILPAQGEHVAKMFVEPGGIRMIGLQRRTVKMFRLGVCVESPGVIACLSKEYGRLLVFYKGFFNNTRKKWLKEGGEKLAPKSDKQWKKITSKPKPKLPERQVSFTRQK